MPNFSYHILLHLVKIRDIRSNVRSLLQKIIHNSEQLTLNENDKIPIDFQYSTPKMSENDNKFAITFLTNLVFSLSMSQKFNDKVNFNFTS